MNEHVWWYTARAAGIVAWFMLSASVIWGVILSTRAFPSRRRPAWLLDLHRWLAALTLGLVGLHIAALVADSYTHFDLVDLAIPLASEWRPVATALGVVAMWLLVVVQVTSLAMRRLPRRVWHAIHLASYVTFWVVSLHAALAGSDRANRLYQASAVAAVAAVAWATVYRLNHQGARRGASRHGRASRDSLVAGAGAGAAAGAAAANSHGQRATARQSRSNAHVDCSAP